MALTAACCASLLRTLNNRASSALYFALSKSHHREDSNAFQTKRLQTHCKFHSTISNNVRKSAKGHLVYKSACDAHTLKGSTVTCSSDLHSPHCASISPYSKRKSTLSNHHIPLPSHQHLPKDTLLSCALSPPLSSHPRPISARSAHAMLSRDHRTLLRVCDRHQRSHHGMSSFSPARLILEATPGSVQPFLRLIRFDRPIGTWLLYWPCTWSIALAAQPGCLPDLRLLALFGAGAFFMRGAGCIINDMWDKDFDAKVERTKLRPLASGELSSFQALVFLGTQLSCALAILLQLNWYSVALGASSLGLVILYPLAKRYTYWPQMMLGLTLNWGVLLGWCEMRGSLEPAAVCLYAACTVYTIIYDTIYSHQDKYDDMLIGVKSTALKLGDQTKPWLYGFTTVMAGGLTTAGLMNDMTWPYYAAAALTCGRLAQQTYSVDLNDADDCAKAFRGNFYLGVVMFAGIVMANLLKSQTQKATDDRLDKVS